MQTFAAFIERTLRRSGVPLSVVITAMLFAVVAVAGQARTPWGDPDLQGIYTSDDFTGVPLERPKEFGERQILTDEEYAKRVEQAAKQSQADSEEIVVPGAPATAQGAAGAGGGGAGTGPPSHWSERGKPQRQASLIVDPPDGRIPFVSEEARTRAAAAEFRASTRNTGFKGPEDLDMWDRCITRRLPRAMLPNGEGVTFQFIQTPGYVAIVYEMIHETRIIPLDGRPHLSSHIHEYFGDSRGHWDGATLVVDVTNFNDKTKYQGSGPGMHLTERFTRIGPGTLRYQFTVEDPTTFTRPWTATLNLTPKPELIEYACHEGNYAMTNILSGSRADEKAAGVK
jgi:hypothetical protein